MTTGCVISFFDPASNARVLIGPDGNPLSTTGTRSHGVNEGIAYAIANKWAFKCLPHEVIECSTNLTIPACAHADIDLGGSDFYFSPECRGPALYMNSFNGGRFHHSGRLIYSGVGTCAAYISPTTPDPMHGQKIIQNAQIEFGELVISGVNVGQGVYYDLSQGSIMNNKKLDWLCVNGWDGGGNRMYLGIFVSPSGGQSIGFNENMIRVGQLQGFQAVGIYVGGGGNPNTQYIGDNEWDAMINTTGGPGVSIGAMVSTWAPHDEWRLSMTVYDGPCSVGLILNPGANYNSYKIRQSTCGVAQVQDSGTGNRAV